MIIHLRKSDGRREKFNHEKLLTSLIRSQVSPLVAKKIVEDISHFLYDGMPTSEIYNLVKSKLAKTNEISGFYLYQLREAVANLDSIAFEKYISQLLRSWGYKSRWNVLVAGKCVEHQVDVVAEKDNRRYLVECKHHRNYHRDSGLGKVMELYARIEDISQLKGNITYSTEEPISKFTFDVAWLVTNTKISYHAIEYAKCRRILLTGWHYGYHLSLDYLSQHSHVYPLTLFGLSTQESAQLVPFNLVTSSDLLKKDIPPEALSIVSKQRWQEIKRLIALVDGRY